MIGSGRPYTDDDRWAFNGGTHTSAYDVLGAHPSPSGGVTFRVWAPEARDVEVIGDFSGWKPDRANALTSDPSGVWHGHVDGAARGHAYKYRIRPRSGDPFDKSDPFGLAFEEPPRTASVVTTLDHQWGDEHWMAGRAAKIAPGAPVSIYELHLGSWRYEPGGYRALADQLVGYVTETGFTHIEVLPVTEHPFYGSWGYQTTGYFAPTSRYGSPADFMGFVDRLHQAGIGVIVDWVPSHFPDDPHGLAAFDGSHLYEHADPRLGYHPDWDSLIFDYGRNEVRSFLLSSAHFWADRYHADGLRVDAVASMLYRDYSRPDGQWVPNEHGGNENLEAVGFLQELNRSLHHRFPDIAVIAEESTAWPGVTRAVDAGGLGFDYKWDMGWMHDTLGYLARDPVFRRFHHDDLTFRSVYHTSENYVLPLSHDEVVHGKGSLWEAMPGDDWLKFANLRLLFGYQWAVPGKKLLFMGSEFGVTDEWHHETELDWGLLASRSHKGVQHFVTRLNAMYRAAPALYTDENRTDAFRWIIGDDEENSVFAFLRQADDEGTVLVVANFTPVVHHGYRLGVPAPGEWTPLLQSDHTEFGGSGATNGPLATGDAPSHGFDRSVELTLGPLSISFFAAPTSSAG